jgi:hypothetical protein
MTRQIDATAGLSGADVKVLNDIREFGWHTVGVFPRDEVSDLFWAFTIGLHLSFRHPEVILSGLPLDRCMSVVNEVGTAVKRGATYEQDCEYSDILQEPYRCAFRRVATQRYKDYVGYALWFYECSDFPLLQCFWPDREGRFPWDEGCNAFVKGNQPLLYLPS